MITDEEKLYKEMMEYASLVKTNEKQGHNSGTNQTGPFPIDAGVEVRPSRGTVGRGGARSQTVHEFCYGSIDQQLAEVVEVPIDVKGVTKIVHEGNTRKLAKWQFLRVFHNTLYLCGDKGEEEPIVRQLDQTTYKPISRKEIVIAHATSEMCKSCKIYFDTTKDMNVAVVDLERYYGADRPAYYVHINGGEEKLQIRHRLLKLLGKRSSKDLLERKGIIRNEPIFGNTLRHLHDKYRREVPEFVTRIIQLIELPKNITSLGLYRASGNLATIQKIRFNIDKNNLKILDQFKNDSDVLTGSMKLFFRELKEPLIPHVTYEELCKLIDTDIGAKAEEHIKLTINKMEKAHRKTLVTLLEHLLKVELHSEDNKMDAYNISIVWGPTLIWPPDSNHENILLSHTNANKIIELLLHVFKKVSLPKQDANLKAKGTVARPTDTLQNKSALMLELSESIRHGPHRGGSKDSITKSSDSLKSQDDLPKTPEKEIKYNLDNLCTREKVPEFVTKAIALIERRIETDSLYKKTGNGDKLEKIRKKILRARSNLSSLDKYNVHDLTWALKKFFADLNEPLIPRDIFRKLITATDERIEATKLRNTRKILVNATIAHKETLDCLLEHLVNVSRHEEANKMSKHNIATEWASFLFKSFIDNNEATDDTCVQILETLLQIYDDKSVVHVETERELKYNLDVYNSLYYKGENLLRNAETAQLDDEIKEKVCSLKRRPHIPKNDSSLYRVSRLITNTLSMYDNNQPNVEEIKNEATVLEVGSVKTKAAEHRTKL